MATRLPSKLYIVVVTVTGFDETLTYRQTTSSVLMEGITADEVDNVVIANTGDASNVKVTAVPDRFITYPLLVT
jgi:hypothetical protein